MYAFLTGTIDEKDENLLVVNVGGVGYEVWASSHTVNSVNLGEVATIYTYLNVREDAMLLFGFATRKEKALFLDLMKVKGVGAKTAIQILSGCSPDELIESIMHGDTRTISSIKGIGKKTAELIVVELKSKFEDLPLLSGSYNNTIEESKSSLTDEAVTLLVNMGLTRTEAVNLVKQVATPDDTIEEIITKALRNMG